MGILISKSLTRPDGQKITGDKPLKYVTAFKESELTIVVNLQLYVSHAKINEGFENIPTVNDFSMRQYIVLTPEQFLSLDNSKVEGYIFDHMEKIVGEGFIKIEE